MVEPPLRKTMEMATPSADAMGHIVALVAPTLKAAGFRKRRNAFNRSVAGQLVHVIDFQMGTYLPGTMYGEFTINLGVYLPRVADRLDRYQLGVPVKQDSDGRRAWVNESDCHLRYRIGHLLTPSEDTWWSLDDAEAAATAVDALSNVGLAWLDGLRTTGEIVDAYAHRGPIALGLDARSGLIIGLLELDNGKLGEGEAMIGGYLAEDLPEPHRSLVSELVTSEGLGHLLNPRA